MSAGSSTSSGPSERFSVRVDGVAVVGVLHLPAARPAPCVVACHGLGASKDSDKYLLLGRMMPEAGFALARFDFRGAGESGGSYRDATIASRVADLEGVLEHLAAHPSLSGRFGLLGSSLGGFVALHTAHRRRARGGNVVVTWNAPAALRDLEEREVSEATGLGPALVAEIEAGLNAEAPGGVSHVLVIQGEADEVVPPAHGQALFDRAGEPRDLHWIPGADHRLTDPRHRADAVERSRGWMTQHLGESESR
jgi:alpha-beta hydrolase superfamily lysophospholipase